MSQRLLTPATAVQAAQSMGRFRFGLGRRFLFLLLIGLAWIVPAFWMPEFLYGLLAWDGLLVLAAAADYRSLPRPRELIVERRWSDPPMLDTAATVELVLRNQGRVGVDCRVLDDAPAGLRLAPAEVSLRAAAGGSGTASYIVQPRQRGDLEMGGCFLRYQSTAQLAERWARVELRQAVRVYPDLQAAGRHTMYLTRTRQIEMEKRLLRQRGMGREFESLREYRQGDEFRDICWTATARRAKLVTKVHRVERSQPVWIVVDCGRLLRARVGELSKLDHAVDAALGLAQLALFSGDRVGLLAYGKQVISRVPLGTGAPHLRMILDQLAVVQPQVSEADHLRAAGTLMLAQRRRGLIVWITDLPETAVTPEVIEGASQALSRHLLLFVVVGEPALAAAAAAPPEDVSGMYRAAAAQEVVHRRELLLARVRQRGALVLETSPAGISRALVNRYLFIKERNLI